MLSTGDQASDLVAPAIEAMGSVLQSDICNTASGSVQQRDTPSTVHCRHKRSSPSAQLPPAVLHAGITKVREV